MLQNKLKQIVSFYSILLFTPSSTRPPPHDEEQIEVPTTAQEHGILRSKNDCKFHI